VTRAIDRLIFIFDANSGAWDAFVDSAKKVLRINGCALCQVTHGLVTEKSEWRACQSELGAPVEYLHRDEIPPEMKELVEGQLPCIVAEANGETMILIDRETIGRCRGNVDDLKGKLLFHASKQDLQIS